MEQSAGLARAKRRQWRKLLAMRCAEFPFVVIHKCLEGGADPLPFRTVSPNTAAYRVGAKEVVSGGNCARDTARVGTSAADIELRGD